MNRTNPHCRDGRQPHNIRNTYCPDCRPHDFAYVAYRQTGRTTRMLKEVAAWLAKENDGLAVVISSCRHESERARQMLLHLGLTYKTLSRVFFSTIDAEETDTRGCHVSSRFVDHHVWWQCRHYEDDAQVMAFNERMFQMFCAARNAKGGEG